MGLAPIKFTIQMPREVGLAPKGPEAIKEWLGELRGPPKGRTK